MSRGFRTVFALPTDQSSPYVSRTWIDETGGPWGAVGRPTASVSLEGGRLSDSMVERNQLSKGLRRPRLEEGAMQILHMRARGARRAQEGRGGVPSADHSEGER